MKLKTTFAKMKLNFSGNLLIPIGEALKKWSQDRTIPRLAVEFWGLLTLLLKNAAFAASLESELLRELGRAQVENSLFEQEWV